MQTITTEQYLHESLYGALLSVDSEKVEAILRDFEGQCFAPTVRVGGYYLVEIPLSKIPYLVRLAIGKPEEYLKEESKLVVQQALERNDKIIEMLSEKFLDARDDAIPFEKYADAGVFFAEENKATLEEIFYVKDVVELKEGGATDRDIQLYCVATKFYFDEVERLLSLGARPDVCIANGEYFLNDRIETEASFLSVEVLPVLLGERKLGGDADKDEFLCDVIGLAAHEKMWSLIKPYVKK